MEVTVPHVPALSRICVYCGSSLGVVPEYRAVAAAFGGACARRGLTIIYGGGSVGLMGTVADAALAAGGEVIGVIPRAMVVEERAHLGLTRLITVETMHERKYRMAELADAFVALPGGIGTLEEIIEVFTWLQLGLHRKPVGLLNAGDFFGLLIQYLAHLRDQGFLLPEHHAMLTVADDSEALLEALRTARHVPRPKPVVPAPPPDQAGLAPGLGDAEGGTSPQMGTQVNKAIIRQYYDELWNHWNFAAADELIAPGIAFRGSLGVTVQGRAAFKNYMTMIRKAFPDFHNHVEEMIAEGDKVVARLTYRGTHQGDLFGFPPTGRKVTYSGIAIFRVAQRRIVEGWVLGEIAEVMKQLE